jgi:hypothetical protein
MFDSGKVIVSDLTSPHEAPPSANSIFQTQVL